MARNAGAGGVGETSRDMLKNTPSNIRRLTDEIEQCEGRQKYIAHTRSPSDGSDVRWFFCKVPLRVNELAASIPHTEIVGTGDYFRFGMRDSLAIEASFLQREEELLSCWWKEYAECNEGPRGPGIVSNPSSSESGQLYVTEEERVGVPVKGGLYEVDLIRRHCFPVYWNGDNRRVLRGHWFALKGGLEWLPLREDVSEHLEHAYRTQIWRRRTFQPSGQFAARVDLPGSILGLHALFTGEDDTWEAWLNEDASGFLGIVGFGRRGIKLRRGYAQFSQKPTQDKLRQQREEEIDDYCSQVPVRHLVFMVHGIGQRLEKSNLVDDVGDFRQIAASVAERHLTDHQLATQRVLYIPCQWRKGLTFSGEVAVQKITLDGVRGLRTMLGATVHDILYYMSPIYCQEIIDSVSNQLNRLYLKFLKRNPGYDGKVSIYGHSLGSVLSYDILCHQDTLNSPFPMEWLYKERKSEQPSSIRNDSPSSCSPSTNFKHKVSEHVEIENRIGPVDCLDLFEEPAEGTINPLGPPVTSESETSSSVDYDCQQENYAAPLNADTNGTFCISNYMKNYKNGTLNDPNSSMADSPCDGGKDAMMISDDVGDDMGICNNGKADTVDMLRGEIDLLKAKIKELEAKCSEKENAISSTVVSQSDHWGGHPGQRDPWKSYTPRIRYTKLEFKVDTFFAVGSPLGVFLSLRNIRIGIGKGKDYWKDEDVIEEMPACRQMFNAFHPSDPVAYRVEPLICKEFIHNRPVIIPYHKGGKRLYVGFQEFKEGLASRVQDVSDSLNTIKVKVLTCCESRSGDGQDVDSENIAVKEKSYGLIMMERLTRSEDGRIDHVLQDKTFRHPYISAIGAHTNYWRDSDTALFIIKHLYRDVPEGPPGLHGDKNCLNGWSDPTDMADEEVPLKLDDGT